MLTQNTSWRNVEKAIDRLRSAGVLNPAAIDSLSEVDLAQLIRPAGYFNVKARRLKAVVRHIANRYGGDVLAMADGRTLGTLRAELLGLHGVGEETADSILLYALGLPAFVVDAYTRRIFARVGMVQEGASYGETQRIFTESLSLDVPLFNDYHAQIVLLGKERCRPREPRCVGCPVGEVCDHGRGGGGG